jgi:glutamyl-tRNA reductase
VTFGLEQLTRGDSGDSGGDGAPVRLAGRRALVIGAGSMSSLAAATLARAGVAELVIANRTLERAERLAAALGPVSGSPPGQPAASGAVHRKAEGRPRTGRTWATPTTQRGAVPGVAGPAGSPRQALGTDGGPRARAVPINAISIAAELALADIVVSCTGASGLVLTAGAVAKALTERSALRGAGRPLAVLDLAMPRDVDAAVQRLDGVRLVDIETLAEVSADEPMAADVDAVSQIVADEVAAFEAAQQAARIAPTVVALRSMAADVVASELGRLHGRLPGLDDRQRAEITRAMRRVVDKLLHAPTVRVKELAGEPGGADYAAALRELFALDAQRHQAAGAAMTASSVPPRTTAEQEHS